MLNTSTEIIVMIMSTFFVVFGHEQDAYGQSPLPADRRVFISETALSLE